MSSPSDPPSSPDNTVLISTLSRYPEPALAVGTVLEQFRILSVLGVGGFGIVYLAVDERLDRRVALKEFLPETLAYRQLDGQIALKSANHAEVFRIGLRSFINEARLLARFEHPSLVKVHHFWEANGTAYMVMPFYEGHTLRQIVDTHGVAPDERWVRALLVPLLGAVELLHAHDCLHRDISPDNILIRADGTPVLLDFGAARQVVRDAQPSLTIILKQGFAPIEQYSDGSDLPQGPWTDLYAIGAVVHFCATGKVPPPSVNRFVKDTIPSLAALARPGFSADFCRVIDRAMAVRQDARIQTIAQLREELALAEPLPDLKLAGPGPSEMRLWPPPRTPAPPTPARRTRWWPWAALGALLLGGGGLAAWMAQHGEPGAVPAPTRADPAVAATPGPTPPPAVAAPPEPAAVPPPLAALFDLGPALQAAADPSLGVQVATTTPAVKVGQPIRLSVTAQAEGHLYLFSIPQKSRQVVMIFPNQEDALNQVRAGQRLDLPRGTWHLEAGEPPEDLLIAAVLSPVARRFEAPRFARTDIFTLAEIPADTREPAAEVAQWLVGAPEDCRPPPDCRRHGAGIVTVRVTR